MAGKIVRKPCKEDWGLREGVDRLTPGLEAAGGRKCVLAGLMTEVKVPARLSKLFPWLQHRRRLRSAS